MNGVTTERTRCTSTGPGPGPASVILEEVLRRHRLQPEVDLRELLLDALARMHDGAAEPAQARAIRTYIQRLKDHFRSECPERTHHMTT